MLVATAGPVTPPTTPPTTAPASPPTAPPETAPTTTPLNLSPVVEQPARLSAAKPARPSRLRLNFGKTSTSCNSCCSTQSSIAKGGRFDAGSAKDAEECIAPLALITTLLPRAAAGLVDLDQRTFPKSLSSWKLQTIRPDGLHRQTE